MTVARRKWSGVLKFLASVTNHPSNGYYYNSFTFFRSITKFNSMDHFTEKLPSMDLMRSEKMTFVQIIIPAESAHRIITYLGQLGLLQFRDVISLSDPYAFLFSRLFIFVFVIPWFECVECVSVFVLTFEFVVLFGLSVKSFCVLILKCCIVEFMCWILEFRAGALICS